MSAVTESILRQEKTLVFDRFDSHTAWLIGSTLQKLAHDAEWPIVIDIHAAGRTLFHAAMPGSTAENDDWVRRKQATVLRLGRSTYGIGRELHDSGETLEGHYGLPESDFAAHGGGFPIHVRTSGEGTDHVQTNLAGAIVVSGLPQREDHVLIVHVLCHILGHDDVTMQLDDGHSAA